MEPATLDATRIFAGLAAVLFTAAGIDLGVAFIMRGQREASSEVYEVRDR